MRTAGLAFALVLSLSSLLSTVAFPHDDHPTLRSQLREALRSETVRSPYTSSWDSSLDISTPLGNIHGHFTNTTTRSGKRAVRYVVKYAKSNRWEDSNLVKSVSSLESLPPACPQLPSYVLTDSTPQSEDCLYMAIYAPPASTTGRKSTSGKSDALPVMVWIHGGSFISGSASSAGLDGSELATFHDKGMIVAVVQYRLGVLGLLPPASTDKKDTNLSVGDLINSLEFLKKIVPSLGGDPKKVVIAGQSSGAGMIRALLSSPGAIGLFRGAILQSDPMGYTFAAPIVTQTLQTTLYSPAYWGCRHISCFKAKTVGDVLSVQEEFLAFLRRGGIPGVPLAEPLRPTPNTPSIPLDFATDLASSKPSKTLRRSIQDIPLLITTVHDEAGSLVQSLFPDPVPATAYDLIVTSLLGSRIAPIVLHSEAYASVQNKSDCRSELVRLATDWAWRCPTSSIATIWAKKGGTVYVGEWEKGRTYPDNEGGGLCKRRACHEDDIYPSFGTTPATEKKDDNLEYQVLTRWSGFVYSLSPNPEIDRNINRWTSIDRAGKSHEVFGIPSGDGVTALCPGIWEQNRLFAWAAEDV